MENVQKRLIRFWGTKVLSFTSRVPVNAVALVPESRFYEEMNDGQFDPSQPRALSART